MSKYIPGDLIVFTIGIYVDGVEGFGVALKEFTIPKIRKMWIRACQREIEFNNISCKPVRIKRDMQKEHLLHWMERNGYIKFFPFKTFNEDQIRSFRK